MASNSIQVGARFRRHQFDYKVVKLEGNIAHLIREDRPHRGMVYMNVRVIDQAVADGSFTLISKGDDDASVQAA